MGKPRSSKTKRKLERSQDKTGTGDAESHECQVPCTWLGAQSVLLQTSAKPMSAQRISDLRCATFRYIKQASYTLQGCKNNAEHHQLRSQGIVFAASNVSGGNMHDVHSAAAVRLDHTAALAGEGTTGQAPAMSQATLRSHAPGP